MENRYIENFRILVDEAHVENHSKRWSAAVKDLSAVHPDLPDIAILAARKLPSTDPDMLAARLSNTAPREIAGIGKESLNNADLVLAVRRTHRNITMQESADQIISEKEGISKASDFMSLKSAIETNKQETPGMVAIEALKRQGIDSRRLLEGLKPAELKAVSVGAYDRISEENRSKLNAALEIEVQRPEASAEKIAMAPTMRPPRNQFSTPTRLGSFGKRIETNKALAGQAMARQSIAI